MDSKNLITNLLYFILFILLQVLLFKNLVLFGISFSFFYVCFLLFLPFEIATVSLLFIGFFTGFVIDIFYDSLGIHSASCVLLMFIRGFWIKSITPRGGYEVGSIPTIESMGWQWFSFYSLPLIFIHHFALFYIEAGGFEGVFFFTLSKVLASTALTFLVIVLFQYLFMVRRKRA